MKLQKTLSLPLVGLLALALAVRLPLILGAPGAPFDMESYRKVVEQLLAGGPLYGPELAGRYPYLPPWALILLLMRGLAAVTGWPFEVCVKLPGLAADLGLTALLFLVLRRRQGGGATVVLGRPFWVALAWALSPLSLLTGAGHGQFESLPLLFVLLAYWESEHGAHTLSERRAALWLGLAVALKTWPILFLPAFLAQSAPGRERLRWALTCLAVPLAFGLPALLLWPGDLLATLSSYAGAKALGLSECLRAAAWLLTLPPSALALVSKALLLLLLVGQVWLAWRMLARHWAPGLAQALCISVLMAYCLAPGLSPQSLCWLGLLSLLLPGRLHPRFTLRATALALLFYLLFMPETLLGPGHAGMAKPPAWVILLWGAANLAFWAGLVSELRTLLKDHGTRRRPLSRPLFT